MSRQAHQRSRRGLPAELRRACGAVAEEDPPEIDLRDAEQVDECPCGAIDCCGRVRAFRLVARGRVQVPQAAVAEAGTTSEAVPSPARRAFSRPGEAVLPVAACRPGSKRGGPSPARTLRTVRRRKAAADRGGPIEPFERALEIAQTRVGVGAIEARLDHLLVAYLTGYALVPPPIVSRLVRKVGDSTRPPVVFGRRWLAGRSGTGVPLVVTRTSVARRAAGWSTRRRGGHAPLLERHSVSGKLDTVCRPGAGADGRPPVGLSEAHRKRNTDRASGHTRFVRAPTQSALRAQKRVSVTKAERRLARCGWKACSAPAPAAISGTIDETLVRDVRSERRRRRRGDARSDAKARVPLLLTAAIDEACGPGSSHPRRRPPPRCAAPPAPPPAARAPDTPATADGADSATRSPTPAARTAADTAPASPAPPTPPPNPPPAHDAPSSRAPAQTRTTPPPSRAAACTPPTSTARPDRPPHRHEPASRHRPRPSHHPRDGSTGARNTTRKQAQHFSQPGACPEDGYERRLPRGDSDALGLPHLLDVAAQRVVPPARPQVTHSGLTGHMQPALGMAITSWSRR